MPMTIPPDTRFIVYTTDDVSRAKHRVHQYPLRIERRDYASRISFREQIFLEGIKMSLYTGRALLMKKRGDDNRRKNKHRAHIAIFSALSKMPLKKFISLYIK